MGVVRRDAVRRWSLVAAGAAVLCLLPGAVAAWPGPTGAGPDPAGLRDRIRASADRPYQGDIATDGRLGLPPLPELAEVGGLLGGSARIRAWYAGPDAWRVAELTAVGERDSYRTAAGLYRWDFERHLFILLAGGSEAWLPGAADLVPPVLARRLLGAPGRLEPLPARRVAGVEAAGLRLVPADRQTTVGRVDVWADPETGLPVRVEVAGPGAAGPVFTSRFLQLRQAVPDPAVLTPAVPDGVGLSVTSTDKLGEVLADALPGILPGTLAGGPRMALGAPAGLATGAAAYGDGFSTVVVVALPGRSGGQLLGAARDAGAVPVPVPAAEAYQLQTSLLTSLVVHADHPDGRWDVLHAWLLAGLVDPEVLRRAAGELVGSL